MCDESRAVPGKSRSSVHLSYASGGPMSDRTVGDRGCVPLAVEIGWLPQATCFLFDTSTTLPTSSFPA